MFQKIKNGNKNRMKQALSLLLAVLLAASPVLSQPVHAAGGTASEISERCFTKTLP